MSLTTRLGILGICGFAVSACGGPSLFGGQESAHINNKVKFTSAAYGVAASPRVTTSRKVRKGGGRRQIGKPYKIKGKWYYPKEEFGYNRVGQASWYGPNFHGRLTANGEVYDQYALTAAHPTFPLPSYARVTNMANGRSIMVRVNDRGPYHDGRIIDLSSKAAEMLDYRHLGIARVRVEYIKQAPLHGLDHQMLAASYRSGGGGGGGLLSGTKIAASAAFDDWKRPTLDRLSDLTTGSIRKQAGSKPQVFDEAKLTPALQPDEAATADKADPFVMELGAIKANHDTGSTLALRLKNLFKPKSAASKP
ncbi:MAG: septal ring lytic transglycosylase RlpA family protein [Rhizobiaceae bacterium]|nr:septal ring lytic transglycosylase RlpA family protein [Rhizobiaceae bacterium]